MSNLKKHVCLVSFFYITIAFIFWDISWPLKLDDLDVFDRFALVFFTCIFYGIVSWEMSDEDIKG